MEKAPSASQLAPVALLLLVSVTAFGGAAGAQTATYSGTWMPMNFGMGGAMEVTVGDISNPTTRTLTASFMGEMFGVTTPPLITVNLPGTLAGNTWTFATNGHPVLGDIVLTVDNTTGAIAGTATNITDLFMMNWEISGTGMISNPNSAAPGDTITLNWNLLEPMTPAPFDTGSATLTFEAAVPFAPAPYLVVLALLLGAAAWVHALRLRRAS